MPLAVVELEDRTCPAPPGSGWSLLWQDNFDGTTVNTANWTVGNFQRRDAMNTSAAVSVAGGNLTVTTYTVGGTHYTGWLDGYAGLRGTYGYMEARINYSDSPGMWSAFWMQSPSMGNPIGNPAAAGTEIDISEHRSTDGTSDIRNRTVSNIHWDGYGANHQSVGSQTTGSGLQGGFHLYAMEWSPTSYKMYLDGNLFWTSTTAVSQRSEYFYLSSEVDNGSWAGNIPAGGYGSLATSTTKMILDYVRVWQRPVSPLADQVTREDTATASQAVTITQRDGVTTSFTGTASNTNLIPSITLGGSGANRTASVTPAADRTGVSTVTLAASNSAMSGNDAYTVTVNAASATNLGFESDLTNWNTYGGTSAANFNQRSGSRALRIVNSGGAEQIVTGLSPSTTYTLGGYGRVTSVGSQGYLGVKNYGGSQLLADFNATSYGLKTLKFTTGTADTQATVFAYKPSTSNEAFFDDFYLFRAPTISTVANQVLFRNTATNAIALTLGNISSDATSYTLSTTSNNTTLLPNANIAVTGSNLSRSLKLTPAANQTGTATVTLTLTDIYGGSATKTFTLTVSAPPAVTATAVNSGAVQRSRLTSVALTFANAVSVSAFAVPGAITLTNGSILVQTGATGANGRVSVSPTTGVATTVTLSFDNANGASTTAGVEYGSLSDGIWSLSLAGSAAGTLKRLFGDANGDGTVDGATDFAQFGNVFGVTTSSAFDFNNDGTIDGAVDFPQFGNRFARTI